jgi:Cupin domain
MHPVPTYGYVVEGTLTVEMDDGSPREYAAGSGFLESVNTWHNGKNLGQAPVKVLVVFVSEEGKKNFYSCRGSAEAVTGGAMSPARRESRSCGLRRPTDFHRSRGHYDDDSGMHSRL